jgi:hypothetical protein
MNSVKITEIIHARGHENIQATHRTTFEITKEDGLSEKGTCIIAVSADKALADLSREFKENLRKERTELTILIQVGKTVEMIKTCGSPQLVLTHPTDIVVRKSSHICDRTLAFHSDKAACDLSRKLVERLKDPRQKVKITLVIKA